MLKVNDLGDPENTLHKVNEVEEYGRVSGLGLADPKPENLNPRLELQSALGSSLLALTPNSLPML